MRMERRNGLLVGSGEADEGGGVVASGADASASYIGKLIGEHSRCRMNLSV